MFIFIPDEVEYNSSKYDTSPEFPLSLRYRMSLKEIVEGVKDDNSILNI